MTVLFPAFAGLVLLVLALFTLVVVAGGALWLRWAGLLVSVALLGGVYLAGTEALGRAKPARLALLDRGDGAAQLVSSLAVEGEAIYLWLVAPGATAPRAYALPWSTDVAEALRVAEAEAEANGTEVLVTIPLDGTRAPGARFSAPPPPELPVKHAG